MCGYMHVNMQVPMKIRDVGCLGPGITGSWAA